MEYDKELSEQILDISDSVPVISLHSEDTLSTCSTNQLEIDTSYDNNSEDRQSNYSTTVANCNQNCSIYPTLQPCVIPMEFGVLSERRVSSDSGGLNGGAHSRVLTQINDNKIVPPLNSSDSSSSGSYGMNSQSQSFVFGRYFAFDYRVNPCNVIKPLPTTARLEITEQPVDKFRFRYKSEMNGTHGALHGTNTQRLPKTYPEVRLLGFEGSAVIRCTLFQVNIESPHSHQLIVRRDDRDYVDPHELYVSPDKGYYAKFMNMGIIHTARRFVVSELLKKKRYRLITELKRELMFSEEHDLLAQCEREAKDMNLNQVRLCFEAFTFAENKIRIPIAPPIFSRVISNRKSATTGDLRITRISIFSGSVLGGDDLILLVDKVNKKNIKVRFYEIFDDDLVWEGYAKFRETDVHHQYAIVCKTPPYRDSGIQNSVEVNIELVRPSDDEHSASVTFRYKPREIVTSRKRRHSNSNAIVVNNSDSSGCSSSFLPSDEIIPRTIMEGNSHSILSTDDIFEELEQLLNNTDLKKKICSFTDSVTIPDLLDYLQTSENEIKQMVNMQVGRTEKDGIDETTSNQTIPTVSPIDTTENGYICKQQNCRPMSSLYKSIRHIYSVYSIFKCLKFLKYDTRMCKYAAQEILNACLYFADQNELGDSPLHDIIVKGDYKLAKDFCEMLEYFKMENILNTILINSSHQNALHYTCLYNRPQIIQPLVRLGCDLNMTDRKGNTPLHLAVLEQNIECLKSCLNSGAEVFLDKLNDDGFTVLHLAIRSNCTEFVEELIAKDRDLIDNVNKMDGGNALHMAIQQEQLVMVQLLLSKCLPGFVVVTKNSAGHTPFYLAQKLSQSEETVSCDILHSIIVYLQNNDSGCKNELDFEKLIIDEEGLSNDNFAYSVAEENERDTDDENKSAEIITVHALIDKYILKAALTNPAIFAELSEIFAKDELWKKLAQLIDFDYLFINRVQSLLSWMKYNVNIINYEKLNAALLELSKDAYDLIINYDPK